MRPVAEVEGHCGDGFVGGRTRSRRPGEELSRSAVGASAAVPPACSTLLPNWSYVTMSSVCGSPCMTRAEAVCGHGAVLRAQTGPGEMTMEAGRQHRHRLARRSGAGSSNVERACDGTAVAAAASRRTLSS